MKKQTKKLVLSKETVGKLDEPMTLDKVAGGTSASAYCYTDTNCNSCHFCDYDPILGPPLP